MRQRRWVLSSGSNRLLCSESILSTVTTGINTYCSSGLLSLRRPLTIYCCRCVDYPPLSEILHTAHHSCCTRLHSPRCCKRKQWDICTLWTTTTKSFGVSSVWKVVRSSRDYFPFYGIWKRNIFFTPLSNFNQIIPIRSIEFYSYLLKINFNIIL